MWLPMCRARISRENAPRWEATAQRGSPDEGQGFLGPIAAIAAVIYFLIDALFLTFIRPMAQALARTGMFSPMAAWVASLARLIHQRASGWLASVV